MAPNRKNIASLVDVLSSSDLQSLQSTVQPKFLPLTDPSEQQQHTEQKQQAPQHVESVSYWDWPADVADEAVDVLSLSNIESNLVQATSVSVESNLVAEHDSYWADQAEESTPTASVNKPQHVEASYWDWPAEQDMKKSTIDNILAEERAFCLVSGATSEVIEKNSKPVSHSVQIESNKVCNDQYWTWGASGVAPHTMDSSHPANSYWDWETTDEKPDAIKALLEYEAVRQMLTADNLVKQIQSQQVSSASSANEGSDDYWSWSEEYGDRYWEAQQPAVAATGQAYWDW